MKLLLPVVGLIPPALLLCLMRWRFKSIQHVAPISLACSSISAPVLLLDVRTHDEFHSGHLANALHVTDLGTAQRLIHEFRTDTRDGHVVAYCTIGYRSARFAKHMASAGCADVKNLEGGIWAWIAAGQRVTKATQS